MPSERSRLYRLGLSRADRAFDFRDDVKSSPSVVQWTRGAGVLPGRKHGRQWYQAQHSHQTRWLQRDRHRVLQHTRALRRRDEEDGGRDVAVPQRADEPREQQLLQEHHQVRQSRFLFPLAFSFHRKTAGYVLPSSLARVSLSLSLFTYWRFTLLCEKAFVSHRVGSIRTFAFDDRHEQRTCVYRARRRGVVYGISRSARELRGITYIGAWKKVDTD